MAILPETKSIRTFIGATSYELSRSFYRDWGFQETVIAEKLSLFSWEGISFYLQDYYVKDWIENSMLLLEVNDVESYWQFLQQLELDKKYSGIKLIPPQQQEWGKECLIIDPAGVLWHVAEFSK